MTRNTLLLPFLGQPCRRALRRGGLVHGLCRGRAGVRPRNAGHSTSGAGKPTAA